MSAITTNKQHQGVAVILWMMVTIICVMTVPGCTALARSKRFLIYPRAAPTRVQLIAGFGVPVDLDVESLTVGYVYKTEYFLPYNASQLYQVLADPFMPTPIEAEGRKKREAHRQPPSVVNEKNVERYTVEAKVIEDEPDQMEHSDNTQQTENSSNEPSQWYDSTNEDDPENSGYTLEDIKIKSPQDLSTSRFTLYRAIEMLAESSGYPGRSCLLRSICETAEAPFSYSNGILGELAHLIMTPSSSVDELSDHSDNEYLKAEQLGVSGAPCAKIFTECPLSLLSKFSGIYETLNMFG